MAGLGGHGQTETLIDLYLKHSRSWLRERTPRVTFVAGDRTLNGVFPLWSIQKNLSVGNLPDLSSKGFVSQTREAELVQSWKSRIEIRTKDVENRILSLSGGNQQKVLFARALATRAAAVLMDDPMRGVDVGTKQEVYSILRSEAENGRTFVWYSTEMDEICLCDRVYVFNNGIIVAELSGDDVTEKTFWPPHSSVLPHEKSVHTGCGSPVDPRTVTHHFADRHLHPATAGDELFRHEPAV